DYDAATERWLTPDPVLLESGETNLYRYASGDPINNVDPSGATSLPEEEAAEDISATLETSAAGSLSIGRMVQGLAVRATYIVTVRAVLPLMYGVMAEGGAEEGAIAYVLSYARYFARFVGQALTPEEERMFIQTRNLAQGSWSPVGATFWQYFANGKTFQQIIAGAMKSGGSDIPFIPF
ncbi:MAG: hypothetical protein M3Z05_15855, partial [Gemmatimonadota bacterium]|nr:hypothetical protein [Gemmatimonadota bacterium]